MCSHLLSMLFKEFSVHILMYTIKPLLCYNITPEDQNLDNFKRTLPGEASTHLTAFLGQFVFERLYMSFLCIHVFLYKEIDPQLLLIANSREYNLNRYESTMFNYFSWWFFHTSFRFSGHMVFWEKFFLKIPRNFQ